MTGPETEPEDARGDTDSDPATNTDEGSDWTDEGGATPDGPAGDTRAS